MVGNDPGSLDPPDRAQPPPLRLVYVAGAHKSGATPLGVLLGSNPSVFYAGELYRFPSPIFEHGQAGRLCSCGAPVWTCPFWVAIRDRAQANPRWLGLLKQGQLAYERWRDLPRAFWHAYRHRAAFEAHLARMVEFLRSIAAESGASVLVESSYNPLRAWLYGRAARFGLETRVLHLVRDGRTFVATETTTTDVPEVGWRWLRAVPVIVGRWVTAHLLSILLLHRRGRYLRLRFEDLLRSPRAGLAPLERFLGLDLSDAVRRVEGGGSFPMRHVAAANRVRLQGRLVLQSSYAQKPRLDPLAVVTFWLMGGWLELWLGYRPGPRPRGAPG